MCVCVLTGYEIAAHEHGTRASVLMGLRDVVRERGARPTSLGDAQMTQQSHTVCVC